MTRTDTTPAEADYDGMAWTAEDLDTAAEYDPRCLELEDEHFRRQDACALAEAWDEAHAEQAAREARPHD